MNHSRKWMLHIHCKWINDVAMLNDPITAATICDAIGRKAIAERLGVGLTAVSNASIDGTFPASWFDAIEALCSAVDHPCPRTLFRFKQAPQ